MCVIIFSSEVCWVVLRAGGVCGMERRNYFLLLRYFIFDYFYCDLVFQFVNLLLCILFFDGYISIFS